MIIVILMTYTFIAGYNFKTIMKEMFREMKVFPRYVFTFASVLTWGIWAPIFVLIFIGDSIKYEYDAYQWRKSLAKLNEPK